MSIVEHGITSVTPSNILLGAGTYYRGLKFEGNAWSGIVLGATSGGGKISIKGEYKDLEVDGALVKFKGQTIKQGGTASAEVNFAEISRDVIKMGTLFKEGAPVGEFDVFTDKANIEAGDYIENFAFVGKTADGSKKIIVIFENAICTSGMEIESKDKEQTVVKLTLDAVANLNENLDVLPVKIYYPKPPKVTFTISANVANNVNDNYSFTVEEGTKWAEFIATNPTVEGQNLVANSTEIMLQGTTDCIALKGVIVKPTEVIIATTYDWITT